MLNVWRLLLSEYWIHITYYSVLVIFRWVCNMWCTGNTAKKKHTVIQSHEFASFFLILLVHFLEIFNEWFFIHGHALRSRQLSRHICGTCFWYFSSPEREPCIHSPVEHKTNNSEEFGYFALSHMETSWDQNSSSSWGFCTASTASRRKDSAAGVEHDLRWEKSRMGARKSQLRLMLLSAPIIALL